MSSTDASTDERRPATHDPEFVEFPHRDAIVLGDARLDNMMTALTALGMEVWTMRRRMLVTEKVLAKHGIDDEEIETYAPSAEEQVEFKVARDQFLKTVYGSLVRDSRAPHLVDLVENDFEDPAIKVANKASTSA